MRQPTTGDLVAVLGAGTMGAGIAEVAARAGHSVLLFDAEKSSTQRCLQTVADRLARDVERGRLTAQAARDTAGRVSGASSLGALARCTIVCETIVEDLAAKQAALAAIEGAVPPTALLTTNTSSLSVTRIASGLVRPERLVGMHFFNPAPRMELVEIVRGERTEDSAVEAATELARMWGKTPIHCASTPGLVVNRIARPFYGEAQRLVEIGASDPATIDAVLREAGGFPMGPFELADLVGQDVNLAVARSVWEQTFYDARYAPTVWQQRLVDAGRLGRKTGRGVYGYAAGDVVADREPSSYPPRPVPARVEVTEYDMGCMGPFFDRVATGGVEVVLVPMGDDEVMEDLPGVRLPGGGLLRVTDGSTARSWSMEEPDGVVLLDWAHDPATCTRVAIMAPRGIAVEVLDEAAGLCQAAGVAVSVVGDVAGGVVARTVSMLVNEAVDLVARGEASATDVDVAMLLGAGHPSGPLEWGDRIGAIRVASVLAELGAESPDGRYRLSSRLDEAITAEENLRDL